MHTFHEATDFETIHQSVLAHLQAQGITPTRLPGVFDSYSLAHVSDLLPGFNKVIIRDHHEIHLSWDHQPEMTNRWIRHWSEGTFEPIQATTAAEPDRPARLNEIRTLVDTLFTADDVRQFVLESKFLEAHLQYLTRNYVRRSPYDRDPMICRIDESRDDLHITLAISPNDLSVRFGFRRLKGHLFDNPLTRFYIGLYENGAFEQANEIDVLGFHEFVGVLSYPDNLKNRTDFITLFGANKPDAPPSHLMERSGGSQMRFIDGLVSTLMVVCGTDIQGRGGIEQDSIELDGNDIGYYQFDRAFATPFADIRLQCGLNWVDLPDGDEGLFAALYARADIHAEISAITHRLPIRPDGYFNRKEISPEDLETLD
jgi:hypothetical protein